ncbi:PAS domain S-box protein [Natrinema salinisoli]|uniref:PAS domain S-box protein n=1 Tax=Natrinema salinisoli TaxID=2878535 RepID=UPI001CEFEEFD|nr:PAS domain S-box protein [Natrinema salinisoli]
MSTRAGCPDEEFWGDVDDDEALHRYRTLVNTIDDGVYQLDSDGHFVAVNDVIVETTGYSREELLGEHVSLVLTDAVIERIEREIKNQVETEDEDIATFEFGVHTADGNVVPCELRINLLLTEGELQGTIGVVRDVSEQKQRLKTIESAQASYDSMTSVLDEANIGVFVLDDEFEVAWADETIERYFGLDRDDLIGRDKRQVVHELVADTVDDPDRFVETVLATYDDNSNIGEFEFRITAGDDREERWLEHRSKPIESGEHAGGWIELYYDITDRKRSEDARHETEEQFQSLVDAVEEDAIFRLDAEGHVVSWNEGAKAIKGYDSEEVLGEHFSRFYTEEDRAAGVPERNLERAAEAGSIEDEGWRVRKDGTRFWANVTITAVRDEKGITQGYLKITRDMTDRHEREQELKSELQRVFGRISDAFYAVDEEYRFTHVNERAEQLLEHSEGELLGKNIWEAFPTIDRMDDVRDAFETAMNSQESTSLEFYNDNLEFWVEANLYPSESGISVYFRDVSERKERERELERYERTIETVWDGVVTLDSDNRFVMVNDAFCEMSGYDREELLGERVTLIHDEDVNKRAEELNEDVLAGEMEYATIEFDLETAGGDRVPVEGRFGPNEASGGSIGRASVVRDISERKERERELAKYEKIVETANDGIYTVDEDGRFTMVNDAYTDLTGYSQEELLGSHVSLVVDEDTIERATSLEKAIAEGSTDKSMIEATVRTADGGRIPAEATFAMLPGDRTERIGIARDISERKERERALEESERRYRTLVENFPNGAVGLYDEDLTYNVVGGELLDGLGFSPDEIVDTTIYGRYPDELVDRIEPNFRAVFDGESNSFDIDLDEHTLLAHTLPVRNADDEIYAGMLVVQDVTELREYQRQLEESNERLEQFAYAASHDLQEPLRMVTSYLQLIENQYGDALDEDGEEFIEFAVDGAERMRQMIDGLLEYSRIETRGDPFEPVDLDDVLDDVREDLQIRIDKSNAEITTDDLPRVDGDDSQLRQVFQNLLSNAIEYSGDEPPQVDISATRDGEQWIISVQDNGIGIDPNEQERIFEVFQRLHTHEEHSGTGIGLALSRRIVERHGGEIWVDSEPDEGSTFSFTLPAVDT